MKKQLFKAALKILEKETYTNNGGTPQFCPENLKMVYDELVSLFSTEQADKES